MFRTLNTIKIIETQLHSCFQTLKLQMIKTYQIGSTNCSVVIVWLIRTAVESVRHQYVRCNVIFGYICLTEKDDGGDIFGDD